MLNIEKNFLMKEKQRLIKKYCCETIEEVIEFLEQKLQKN